MWSKQKAAAEQLELPPFLERCAHYNVYLSILAGLWEKLEGGQLSFLSVSCLFTPCVHLVMCTYRLNTYYVSSYTLCEVNRSRWRAQFSPSPSFPRTPCADLVQYTVHSTYTHTELHCEAEKRRGWWACYCFWTPPVHPFLCICISIRHVLCERIWTDTCS